MNTDELQCLFHATVEERDGSYVVEIPEREVELGSTRAGQRHRVGLFPPAGGTTSARSGDSMPEAGGRGHSPSRPQRRRANTMAPPVSVGDERTVDIEDIGEQGDGIARVDRGYIVIVPDTEQGERVTIEITDVAETVGFADVVDREPYYE